MSVAFHAEHGTDIPCARLAQYQQVRQHSEALIAPLSAEDCALQAAAFVSPAKWHLAHTTWFFETFILLPHVPGYQAYKTEYQHLFNSYYNGIGKQFARPKRHLLSRPSLQDILDYRHAIDDAIMRLLQDSEEWDELVVLGLNHEQQHQELLLMDLKYCFFQNPLFPVFGNSKIDAPAQLLIHEGYENFAGGLFEIGAQGSGFHFDNETPRHQIFLKNFQLARSLVSNEMYLAFIEDGGYEQAMLWLSDGWVWRQSENVTHPLYWVKQADQWFEYSLQGLKPLNKKQAVSHVSFYEAHAFAQWCGTRLPTEAEWEVAAHQTLYGPHQTTLAHMFDHNWQWTQSAYQPYPGFKTPQGAVGEYNGKFMCNQMVLRGGCDLTPEKHSRMTYRNFFYPQDQWVKTGIRLAKDLGE
ncbi:MAG: ergothioneine biosynthesis protein EgtB [Gammaproteobacteria bacterium]|nr:ergothioneine biosynthesis protein EgtB [Gammaproteobacteria bacterium]